jgi:hypothetical protein
MNFVRFETPNWYINLEDYTNHRELIMEDTDSRPIQLPTAARDLVVSGNAYIVTPVLLHLQPVGTRHDTASLYNGSADACHVGTPDRLIIHHE